MQQKAAISLQLLCPLSKRLFSSFVALKNWRRTNKKRCSRFDIFIQKPIWPTTWFSSLPSGSRTRTGEQLDDWLKISPRKRDPRIAKLCSDY